MIRETGSAGFVPFGIGHNNGPPLDPGADWRRFCWKKAHARAWKTPPREIALARLARVWAGGPRPISTALRASVVNYRCTPVSSSTAV